MREPGTSSKTIDAAHPAVAGYCLGAMNQSTQDLYDRAPLETLAGCNMRIEIEEGRIVERRQEVKSGRHEPFVGINAV